MRLLGRAAAKGDFATVDKIEAVREGLYSVVGENRARANAKLMRAAFVEIGDAVSGTEETDPAFRALLYAHQIARLNHYTPDAFGLAAAKGHVPSLKILINYPQHEISAPDALFALSYAAKADNDTAIDFLANVIESDQPKSRWYAATRGLFSPAHRGNQRAKQALAKYQDYLKTNPGNDAAAAAVTSEK